MVQVAAVAFVGPAAPGWAAVSALRRPRCAGESGLNLAVCAAKSGARRRAGAKDKVKTDLLYVEVENPEYDLFRLDPVAELLKNGAVGVVPTDTCYAFACALGNREGVNTVYSLKAGELGRVKKPLSILCRDIAMVQEYVHSLDRPLFKLLKSTLPGPYTYILPTSSAVPRMVIEHKSHRKSWKRREIGIRVPDDPYCLGILAQMDEPLLCSSVPEQDGPGTAAFQVAEISDRWRNSVDFVVDCGYRETRMSTVVDLTTAPPTVLREGEGDSSLFE